MISLSDSAPAVSCASSHTLETSALGTVPSNLSGFGPSRPGPEMLTAQAGSACPYAPIRPYLGAADWTASGDCRCS
jgi:hypothetical protein